MFKVEIADYLVTGNCRLYLSRDYLTTSSVFGQYWRAPKSNCTDSSPIEVPATSCQPLRKDNGIGQLALQLIDRRWLHAPPSGGVVIHDGPRHIASALARRTSGTLQRRRPKEEDAADSPPPPPAKKWWEMEAEVQAAFRGGDEPEEFPGQHLIVGRSVKEDYRQITLNPRQAAVWSAMDHGENFVDLAGPPEPLAPKEEEDDFSDDGGGNGGSSDAATTTRTTSTAAPSRGAACLDADNLVGTLSLNRGCFCRRLFGGCVWML
nr:uncharacterized protein LOC127321362 [Lolium perenne]